MRKPIAARLAAELPLVVSRETKSRVPDAGKDLEVPMCLAVPGRVLSVDGADPAFRLGSVDFCGIRKSVNLAFTPEAQPGDFVLVHVGFAIARIDGEEAMRTFQYLKSIGALTEEGFAP